MQTIQLAFPPFEGEEEGLNDAGIETFEGDVEDHIARECGQNTCDAALDKKEVQLHFSLLTMLIDQLPCLLELKDVFTRCISYWEGDPKAVSFFSRAKTCLEQKTIGVLKISDYGTTGLTGTDTDRTGRWYSLVRAKGACNKDAGAGGSFGIGKYAPFAASKLRTVYYYTRTSENEAFQGVSRLVTHLNPQRQKVHPTGYIGECIQRNGVYSFNSIRNAIPELFRRPVGITGTDIYVPAYRESGHWEEQLIISVLENFWPAICMKKIVFKINNTAIDSNNIAQYMEHYKQHEAFKAYRYFNAYKNGVPYTRTLEIVGNSELRLIIDDMRESKPIAVCRKSGMIIDTWGHFSSRKPISGIYICHDENGNEILRKLEPPRHDKWDPKRGENGKKVIDTIRYWIRSCIDSFLNDEISDSFQISEMAQYLPDDQIFGPEAIPPSLPGGLPSGPQETTTSPITGLPPRTPPIAEGGQNATTGEEEGTSGGGGVKEGGGKGGDGHDGRSSGAKDGGNGTKGGKKTPKGNLRMRCMYDEVQQSYTIVLRSDAEFESRISFGAVGDDGEVEMLRIEKVMQDNKELPVEQNGFFVKLNPDSPQHYKLVFEEKEKMTLRIIK